MKKNSDTDTAQHRTAEDEKNESADFDESIIAELARPGYFERARIRAKRRKSAWNLLLVPAVLIPFGLLWWLSFRTGNLLHIRIYPGQNIGKCQGLGTILVAVSPLFGALPVAIILGNFLVWLLPPARRVLDQEAKTFPSTAYRSAQKQLFKFALVTVPVWLLLSAVGVMIPWIRS